MDFLDLFAGIGMFRIGLERAGFHCIGHCEIDKFANKSYEAMHGLKVGEWFAKDIRAIQGKDLPCCSLWTAGFPCQDISVGGKRKGLQGARSGLFFEIVRLLQEKKQEDRPRWLLLENVKGVFFLEEREILEPFCVNWPHWGMVLNMRLVTRKTMEFPKTGNGCLLSAILQEEVPEKYFLTDAKTQQLFNKLLEDGKEKGYILPTDCL